MFKKNSWIVALLLALTLTAFFAGCIAAPPEAPEEEYEEVELGAFNVWGGQTYQRGWSVGGLKFSGVGDKPEVAKDLGYDNDSFIKATKLKIEMEDSTHPNGNLDIIWGAADENGDSVGLDWKQTGAIPFVKDGNVITVDLTEMGDYAKYKDASVGAKRKIVLQAGAEKAGLPFVKKAWLLVPVKEEPFVSLTGLTLKSSGGVTGKPFELVPIFDPEKPTVQSVTWAIYKDTSVEVNNSAEAEWADDNTSFNVAGAAKSKNKIISNKVANTSDPGPWTVKVKATLKAAKLGKDAEGNDKYEDFEKDFVISFKDPVPFEYKVDGVVTKTKEYAGVANDNGASSDMEVDKATPGKYTITMTGNSYGNAYSYFMVDLGSNRIGEFEGVKFTYTPVSGDALGKTIRVKAALDPPPVGYNPGKDVARSKGDALGATLGTGVNADLKFGYNDTTINNDWVDNLTDISSSRYIYLWFLPWSDASTTKFSISDVQFYKLPVSYKLGTTTKTTLNYAGVYNGGSDDRRSIMKADSTGAYTITMVDNSYGNAYSYFEVDFGSEKLSDYKNIKFTYTPISGDATNKTIRVKANATPPISTYNPGLDISRSTDYSVGGTMGTGDTKTLVLGTNGDAAGAFTANITTLSAGSKIYLWFLPWSDGSPTVFKISGIELTK